eukprot:GHVP01047664.1.p1 GENE.GHVP01047664.1~~GHVP01047664.1.p1  ORF type:complete len:137 (+),score=24.79 GHVP01047664.1:140-550(+)
MSDTETALVNRIKRIVDTVGDLKDKLAKSNKKQGKIIERVLRQFEEYKPTLYSGKICSECKDESHIEEKRKETVHVKDLAQRLLSNMQKDTAIALRGEEAATEDISNKLESYVKKLPPKKDCRTKSGRAIESKRKL